MLVYYSAQKKTNNYRN